MASHIPVGLSVPPRDLTSATDARTTRLCRTLQRRSSARCAITHELSPALRCDLSRRRCRVHRIPASRFVTIGRNAPLHRGGMARGKHGFRKNRSKIFFARGLDSRISVESAHEIRFFAHADLLDRRAAQVAQQSPILPDGQITAARSKRRRSCDDRRRLRHWRPSRGHPSASSSLTND
jgi:hypothetical protein